ncbi:Chalcone synthase A (Fragment) [Seminavis robusta]|uniref:Chalcone synthase A n=1 Tax=Seminavis robusta TaxID=568900 RepID=A0A9N8GZ94_9STRA
MMKTQVNTQLLAAISSEQQHIERATPGSVSVPGLKCMKTFNPLITPELMENALKTKTFGRSKAFSPNLSFAVDMVGSPATAFPETSYTQQEVGNILDIKDPVTWKLLSAPHIKKRHLYLPPAIGGDQPRQPTPSQRNATFMKGLDDIGVKAVEAALSDTKTDIKEIDMLVTVTSTGLALPGVSGILIRKLPFRGDVLRSDIVGMGCNGGASGLRAIATQLGHMASIRGKECKALLLCCEVNSAYFVNRDGNIGDGVVNSLFGDGDVASILAASPFGSNFAIPGSPSCVSAGADPRPPKISLLDFQSITIPEYFEDMSYNMDEQSQLPFFKLSKRIPMAVGNSVEIPVRELLDRHGLAPADVCQWVVHGGGKSVMQLVAKNLGLDHDKDLRHTKSVLRDYGNISSGSFLVSLQRLLAEAQEDLDVLQTGDVVALIAMGPGATIEVILGVVTAAAK